MSRALSESYLESHNFIPYTPYSVNYKKEYQIMMAKYSVEALTNLKSAYGIVAEYFLYDYNENINDLMDSVSKLSKAVK